MARINIEECWWSDPRREKLARLAGSTLAGADGLAVQMWRLAQEFWSRDQQWIPFHIFETLDESQALLGCGLAVLGDGLVYVRGSSQYFAWVNEQKQKAVKGGKKSAERPRNEKGQLLANSANGPTKTQAESKQGPSEAKQIQVSDSGSGSYSDSLKKELKAKSAKADPPLETGRFIGTYVQAWSSRYKSRPDLRGKVQGQIKTFLKDTPIERACELIQVYCQMDDPWFVKKCHDFSTFLENIGKVNIALDTGQAPSDTPLQDPFAFLREKKLQAVPGA